MFQCERCEKTFERPEKLLIGVSQNEIKLICPYCGDDRITYLWEDEQKGKENKKEK